MGEPETSDSEPTLVRATIQGYRESFWARPLPGQTNAGTVENVLHNGAIGFGDVIEWNDNRDVVAVRSRSNRATVAVWIETDPEDLATEAKWTQVCKDAAAKCRERGMAVEGGLGMLTVCFVVRSLGDLTLQCDVLLDALEDDDWQLQVQIGPTPGSPTDPDEIGLGLPPPLEDDFDVSGLPDLGPAFLDDVHQRDLITRLRESGDIHAEVGDAELLDYALHLARTDSRCYRSCEAGRSDQVLVFAARGVGLSRGLMMGPLRGYTFETDFLRG